jgi:RND superfamily putative drug exporter
VPSPTRSSATKIAATGPATGILLEATIIRAPIVPVVMLVMGRWNWSLPRWPARLLRVEPSRFPRPAAGLRSAR